MSRLRVVTWNLYGATGQRLADIGKALADLSPDLIALQEIEARRREERRPLLRLAEATGLTPVAGAADWTPEGGWYGNGLLAHHALVGEEILDLSVAGRERRSALFTQLEVPEVGGVLNTVVLHLGLKRHERRRQARKLARHLQSRPEGPLLLLGDLNEWMRVGTLAPLAGDFTWPRPCGTFPSRLPFLPLDRIAAQGLTVHRCYTPRLPRAARLSDHLPLVAEVGPAPAARALPAGPPRAPDAVGLSDADC